MAELIVRLRTRAGTKRLLFGQPASRTTWGDLQLQVQDVLGIPAKEQLISLTPAHNPTVCQLTIFLSVVMTVWCCDLALARLAFLSMTHHVLAEFLVKFFLAEFLVEFEQLMRSRPSIPGSSGNCNGFFVMFLRRLVASIRLFWVGAGLSSERITETLLNDSRC